MKPQKTDLVAVHAAKPKETPIFLSLVRELADYEGLPGPAKQARRRLIRDGFGQTRRFDAYFGCLEGMAVGYSVVLETYSTFLAKPTLYLEDIFVLPEYSRSGVGQALLKHAIGLANPKKCGRMERSVLDWNKSAR